ncbi:MAG: glycosyltransferase family 2 protein [Bacteroidia bacterium]
MSTLLQHPFAAAFFIIGLIFLGYRLMVVLLNIILDTRIPIRESLELPTISILIPARNEARNLTALFAQLKYIEHQVAEIIILDDQSEDLTPDLLRSWELGGEKRKVLKGSTLPAGWLGKHYACANLAQAAKSDYFLFLDADIAQLDTRLLPSIFTQIKKRKLSLISIFPDQHMLSLGEKTVVPLMHYLLLSLLPLRWIYSLPFASMAAANGQCMVFEAKAYRQHKWHEQVKSIIVEDIAIMKAVKSAKLKGLTFTANGLIWARMYQSFGEGLAGFGKNILSGFGNSVIGLIVYLVLLLGFPILLIFLGWQGVVSGKILLLILGGMIGIKAGISMLANQSIIQNLLLAPVHMISMLIVAVRSIINLIRKKNTWKGRNVQL